MTNPSLENKRIVVFGATGNVGFGVASAALDAGASVILPARSTRSEAELHDQFAGRDARVVLGDVSDGPAADGLARRIREQHGPIDHVVASLGAWWSGGRLVDQTSETWEEVRRMLLDSHVHAARTMLPLLSGEESAYVIITGEGAVRPLPAASLLTIALGGTLALSRLLRAEHRRGVRVNEVRIASRVEARPRPGVVPARAFGEALLQVLASDVRGAVIPFSSPATFDVHARVHEEDR
jgi:3-oxoacyl-[acyl-carrier protein] reductase